MGKYVYWFRELVDVSEEWAKQLNYGKLYVAGFPVPTGFVVAPSAKREIQKEVGVDDVSKISPSSIPENIRRDVVDHYFKMNIDYNYDVLNDSTKAMVDFGRQANLVLVRAGNKAYPNIRGTGEVLEAVLKCFALGIGPVVVQKMISPEKAGLVYTSKAGAVSVEATYGFASPIATKAVEPDVYTISRAGEITNKSRGAKRFALVTNPHSRTIERVEVSREKQGSYVLHQREIEVICRLASKLETHAGKPQKLTWGIDGRKVYLLDTEDYADAGVSSYDSGTSAYSTPAQPSYGFEKPSFGQPAPERSSIFDAPTETVAPLGGLAAPIRPETESKQSFSSSAEGSAAASAQHDSYGRSDSYGGTTNKESSSSGSSGFGDWGGFGGEQASSPSTPSGRPESQFGNQSPFASQPSQPESKSDDMFSDFAGAMNMFDSPAPRPQEPAYSQPSTQASPWQQEQTAPQSSTQTPSWQSEQASAPSGELERTSTYDPFKPSAPEPAVPTHSTSDFSGFGASSSSAPSTFGADAGRTDSLRATPVFGSPKEDASSLKSVSDPFSSTSSTSYGATSVSNPSYAAFTPKKGVIISSKESAQSVASQPTDAVLIKMDDINQGGYATPDNMARTIYDITAAFSNKETIVRLGDARANVGFTGARGVRRLGTQELETELAALAKIATHRPDLKLAIPFVTSVDEVRSARDALARHSLGSLSVGVVIETPAAVSIAGKLAEQASFVLIDVEHLAELMLAVDKSDRKVGHLFNAKHDAVFNAVKGAIKLCRAKNVPVYVCGTASAQHEFSQLLKEHGADLVFEEAKDFNSSSDSFGSSVLGW